MPWLLILLLPAAFLLLMAGRTGHPELSRLASVRYAHRGLYGAGIPEISLAAFRRAAERGFGAELDVHLLADGSLAVLHDSSLKRVTGKEGRVEDLTAADLCNYSLEGTAETIPLFADVLKLFEGKAPLIVEVKVVDNTDAVCSAVAAMLDGYKGDYCVESFHPAAVAWFRKHRPQVVRGQLSENYFVTPGCKLPSAVRFLMRFLLTNLWTRPDFVAYNWRDRGEFAPWVCRRVWGLASVAWTLKDRASFDEAVSQGHIPIFEGFIPD